MSAGWGVYGNASLVSHYVYYISILSLILGQNVEEEKQASS